MYYNGTHSFVIFAPHGELWRFVAPHGATCRDMANCGASGCHEKMCHIVAQYGAKWRLKIKKFEPHIATFRYISPWSDLLRKVTICGANF